MDLPNAKHREKYIEAVKNLEEELKTATSGSSTSDLALHSIQQELDVVAKKYQDDEKIGTARYKLYELQAFVHYFEHQDERALDFISSAIEMRGNTYQKAEKLKAALLAKITNEAPRKKDESKMTQAEKRRNLIGLEGWLALFAVGTILSLCLTVYHFFSSDSLSSSDISTLNEYQQGLGNSLQALTSFENIAVIIYVGLIITTLVLLFRKRKSAKTATIITLIYAVVYGVLDYSIASAVLSTADILQTAETQSMMSKYGGDIGKNIVIACIWIPYFLVSKRVKATLTRV